jgi:methyl-accepting chemotaxis protein
MTNKSGVIISHQDTELVLSQYNPIEEAQKDPSMQSLAATVRISQQEPTGSVNYTYNGRNMVVGFAPVQGFDWTLFVTISRGELMAGIDRLIFLIVSFGAAFIALGLLIACLLGRSITKSLGYVTNTLQDISEGEGDLTRQIDLNRRGKDEDELCALARYFNLTINKIKRLVLDVKDRIVSLSATGEELYINMSKTANAVIQITSNIQSINTRIETQKESVEKTGASVAHITDSISELHIFVNEQLVNVNQSVTGIQNLIKNTGEVTGILRGNMDNITELASASEIGKEGVQKVAADIQEISLQSEGLLTINAVIENIASQTNLLSMNAAIEAAHAGEAGKGFAVVAGEIRKLAESSKEQSKTINSVLKKIKESIDNIRIAADGVLKRFEAIDAGVKIVTVQETNMRQAMAAQEHESGGILETVHNLSQVTGKVKQSTQDILNESENVIKESEALIFQTEEITGGIHEIAAGTQEINMAVTYVNTISSQNRENIGDLVKAVSRFKV